MKISTIVLITFFVLANILEAKGTSISDDNLYPQFCRKAACHENVFINFKQHPIYTNILEHLKYDQGKLYLKKILQQTPDFVDYFEIFRENDRYGNPITYYYDDYGVFSPTTLRYIKVASDLHLLFNDLSNMDIIEIGGGYGGLCKIIGDLSKYKSYTIVDLPEVLALVKKYLSRLGIKNVTLITLNEIPDEKNYDLVISNYAFTECVKSIQEVYFTKILRLSQRGYLTCNNFKSSDIWSKEMLLERLNSSGIAYKQLIEEPLTTENNYCIIWQ